MLELLGQTTKWNLYHYTDLNALINIVQNEGILLWATNFSYLNDTRELIEGINTAKRIEGISIPQEAFRNYYVTSFSAKKDALNMWGMYAANGLGCAIGFDFDTLSKTYPMILKCSYGDADNDAILNNGLDLVRNGCMAHISSNGNMAITNFDQKTNEDMRNAITTKMIIGTCLSAKNEAYKEEEETRGVVYIPDGKYVKFRSKNGYIIPYVQVSLPKESLKEIVVGPTSNSELTIQSIFQMLSLKNYDVDNIKVTKSIIPYRG